MSFSFRCVALAVLLTGSAIPASAQIRIDPSVGTVASSSIETVLFRRFGAHGAGIYHGGMRPGAYGHGVYHGGFARGGYRYHGGYAYRGGGYRYGGYRYGYPVAAGVAGLATGAVIGGAIASQAQPVYVGGNGSSYCASRYRSYDPASGTFLGNDGLRHPCP